MEWSDLFNAQFVLVTVFNYPLSLLEILGSVTNLACVILSAREKVLSWPVGILGIVFFFFMFYQFQLYSDMSLQVFFLVMSFYGWWRWTNPLSSKEKRSESGLKIRWLSVKARWVWVGLIGGGTLVLGLIMGQIHLWMPQWFPLPASVPFLDALTTVLSVAATLLMAEKRVECWVLWILVDVISVGIYIYRGIHLTAVLYLIFGVLAYIGFRGWFKQESKQEVNTGLGAVLE